MGWRINFCKKEQEVDWIGGGKRNMVKITINKGTCDLYVKGESNQVATELVCGTPAMITGVLNSFEITKEEELELIDMLIRNLEWLKESKRE